MVGEMCSNLSNSIDTCIEVHANRRLPWKIPKLRKQMQTIIQYATVAVMTSDRPKLVTPYHSLQHKGGGDKLPCLPPTIDGGEFLDGCFLDQIGKGRVRTGILKGSQIARRV